MAGVPNSVRDNLTGLSFGLLTVKGYARRAAGSRVSVWECRCECGKTTEVRSDKLKSGHTRSCGCLNRVQTVHGFSGTPEYRAWANIHYRCDGVAGRKLKNYGARGIKVCDRWRNGNGNLSGYECFLADMGPRPSPRHSVDRIDVDKDYSPENCRWATSVEQQNNRRNNIRIDIGGSTLTFADTCRLYGVPYRSAYARFKRGRPLHEIFKGLPASAPPVTVLSLDDVRLAAAIAPESTEASER